jgi:hypothetical protein
MVGAPDLCQFAIDVLQNLVYGFELGDGVLVDLSLLFINSFNCIRSGTEFVMDELALN